MNLIDVRVYQPNGTTLIALIPRRLEVKGLDELNGDGSGSFQMHLDDPILTTYPQILTGGNIVKYRLAGAASDYFAWQLEQITPVQTSSQENAGRLVTLSGRGLRTLLATGTLYPERGIASNSADDRGFTYASNTGPWYIAADWVTPHGVAQSADTTARATCPKGWPDPGAQWIWSSDPLLSAPLGRNWFRSTFTVSSADAGAIGIYATADNAMSLTLNGDVILESDPTVLFAWQDVYRYTALLDAGTHTIAARVDNAAGFGANPAGFLCLVTALNAAGDPQTTLRRTDTTNWLVHSYGPPEPGWPCAQILKKAVLESQARSEAQPSALSLGFTDTLDTAGVAWTDRQSERFPIGGDLLTMLGRLIELGLDVEVSPTMVINAWVRRGTDRSATVELLPGRDIISNSPTAHYGALRNSALVRHGTGWVLVEDSASITAHGKRSTGLTLGGTDSDTQATQQARAFFDESAHPQITLPVSGTTASTGPQPYVTFWLGDTIKAPGLLGTAAPARVMSIAMSENEGYVDWDLDLYPEVS